MTERSAQAESNPRRWIKRARAFASPWARQWRAWTLCRRPLRKKPAAFGTVSLITTNFGNTDTFPILLRDWIAFMGVAPYEVVVVDGGSPPETVEMYTDLFQRGLIDKLHLMQSSHPENKKDLCFIQEYYSGVLASGDYLLFFKQDSLPYRDGHANWLEESMSLFVGDDRLFAITGTSPGPDVLGEASRDYWCLERVSENFALLPRRHHVNAMQVCCKFWASGWRGTNPFIHIHPVAARCLIECAWDKYCRKQGMRALMRKEGPAWSVFHTNAVGAELMWLRERNRLREGLDRFYNRQRIRFRQSEFSGQAPHE